MTTLATLRCCFVRTALTLTLALGAVTLETGSVRACGSYGDRISPADRAAIEDALQRHFVVRFDSPELRVDDVVVEGDTATAWVGLEGDDERLVELVRNADGWRVLGATE